MYILNYKCFTTTFLPHTIKNKLMKVKMILLFLFISCSLTTFAQEVWQPKFGYSRVQAGNGDIAGHLLLAGMQKQFTKHSGLEVLASGTYIERNRHWGQGYKTFEKSNGVAVEAAYNLYLNLGPFQVYPAVGPVVRYASESRLNGLGFEYNSQGTITKFESEVNYQQRVRAGYVLALNTDVKFSQRYTLGLRGSVQKFAGGQQLASLGVTFKL